MGYNSHFELTWAPAAKAQSEFHSCRCIKPEGAKYCPNCGIPVGVQGLDEKIRRTIEEGQKKNDDWLYGIEPDGRCREECKWYDADTELQEFSRQFPGVVFTLNRWGEERGDITRTYFLNGKTQKEKAVITFQPPAFSELLTLEKAKR